MSKKKEPAMEGAGRRLVQELEQFIIPALEETGEFLGRGAYGEVVKMKMNGETVAVKKVYDAFIGAEGADNYLAKFEEECVRFVNSNLERMHHAHNSKIA